MGENHSESAVEGMRSARDGQYSLDADNVPPVKVGSTNLQGGLSEVTHGTDQNEQVRIAGITPDPEDPDAMLATRYVHNTETGEVHTEHGRIRGVVRETGHYIWEHRKPVSAVASLAISVTLGSLWVRHRKRSS